MIQMETHVMDRPLPSTAPLNLQVCVLTYKRPRLLRLTLASLLRQQQSDAAGKHEPSSPNRSRAFALHILIVDNDPSMTGHEVFEEVLRTTQIPIRYLAEPVRGIASARNTALEESQEMDLVAFIDDDETADVRWLSELVETMIKFGADVVTGPAIPHHENSPEWVKRGKFFEPKKWSTGDLGYCAATNNVMMRKTIAKAFRFDPRFNPTGGEDTEFFMRVHRAGHKIVWAMEALVTETISSERANLRWILNRSRSEANRHTRSCLRSQPGMATRAKRLLIACMGFLGGACMLPLMLFGRHYAARGLGLIFRALGTLSALAGQEDIYYGVSKA